jgi:hypothetical protein
MSFLSSIGSFLGGFLMAVSTHVVGSFGSEPIQMRKKQTVVCPHIVIEVLPEGESLAPFQNQWAQG